MGFPWTHLVIERECFRYNFMIFMKSQGLRLTPPHRHFGHPQRDRTNRWCFNMAAPIIGNPLAECIFIIRQQRAKQSGVSQNEQKMCSAVQNHEKRSETRFNFIKLCSQIEKRSCHYRSITAQQLTQENLYYNWTDTGNTVNKKLTVFTV